MSLKAKLEAVIYAADEPVTLTQLASLFAAEALEWKAQLAATAAEAQAEAALTNQTLPLQAEPSEVVPSEETEVSSESDAPVPEEQAPIAQAGEVDPESEARRQARQRDREVRAILRQLLDQIIADYAYDNRGVEIREIAGGFRMATKPECHDAVRLFIKSLKPPLKLSLPALETLAVIAYKQPVTAPEVNEIRGVESAGVLGSLMSRKLITTAGRKQVIGRPILYKTTKEFLVRFGLKDVTELPSMEEFEKIAAVELAEASEETESGFEHVQAAGPELDPDAPEPEENSDAGDDSAPAAVSEPAAASDAPAPQTEAETVSHD